MTVLNNLDNLLRRFPGLKQFLANPVVIRDLRAQMRGARSYWYIGGYLTLIGLIAVAGYAQSTGQGINPATWSDHSKNIIDAQASLEGFYAYIFYTLAILITLIAPALTAASVVGERQRQSFDLLVTTPLTAGHLLIGKLMSSIAFLGMLLMLSLPASALCILLGGATIGDVLRIYLLLAVDGIVLSAIGLYFSCAVRVPLLATIWTYVAVLGFLGLTFMIGATSILGQTLAGGGAILSLSTFCGWLNPYFAVVPVATDSNPYLLPGGLIVFLLAAGLVVRLLLTAATYRMGLYGATSGVSLRRQALLITALSVFVMSSGIVNQVESQGRPASLYAAQAGFLLIMAFCVMLPFLPGLFVPATDEEGIPGSASDTVNTSAHHRIAVWNHLFRPQHSGALPWYLACLGTLFISVVLRSLGHGAYLVDTLLSCTTTSFYLFGLGVLLWSLSRLAGSMVADLSSARATAFGMFVAVAGFPILIASLGHGDWQTGPLINFWIFNPLLHENNLLLFLEAMIRSGVTALSLGSIVFLYDLALRQGKNKTIAMVNNVS